MALNVRRDGQVIRLGLNRPEDGNRLDGDTLDELVGKLTEVREDGGPDVVVLEASGPDFCLGRVPATLPVTPQNLANEFGRIQHVNELVQSCPAVTVAVLRGRAFGAGLSLAARCDIVLAADDAVLAFPEVPHGIPPTIVLSHYAYVLQPKHLMDLILTGREIDPHEGRLMGLVSRVVPAIALDGAVTELVDLLASHDQRSVRLVKRFLQSLPGINPREAPRLGIAMYANEMVGRELAKEGDSNE